MAGMRGGMRSGGGRKGGRQETGNWEKGRWRLDSGAGRLDRMELLELEPVLELELAEWRMESMEKAVAAAL